MKFLSIILALVVAVTAIPGHSDSDYPQTPPNSVTDSVEGSRSQASDLAAKFEALIERILWINEDSGVDIEKSFCDGNIFQDVILKDHPELNVLVNEMHNFSLLAKLAKVDFSKCMCDMYRHSHGKRDENFLRPLASLKTKEGVIRFILFMKDITDKIGILDCPSDVESE